MKESTAREQILTSIRNALLEKVDNPYPDVDFTSEVFQSPPEGMEQEVLFARELLAVGGQFVYCENEIAFLEYLSTLMQQKSWQVLACKSNQLCNMLAAGNIPTVFDLRNEDETVVGITSCEKLIARTGSVLVSSLDSGGRSAYAYPDVHIVKAYASQVVMSLKKAFIELRNKYPAGLPSQLTLITGPSRTADIEKTLVMGAHGPKELYVFLIDDL
jgi:L-lactate dehydrogenase complex protein LldG